MSKVVSFYLTNGGIHSAPLKDNSENNLTIEHYENGEILDGYFKVDTDDGTKLFVKMDAVDVFVIGEARENEQEG